MKYFRIIGPTPEEDCFVSTQRETDTPETIVESFHFKTVGVVEISKAEFDKAIEVCYLDNVFEEELPEGVFLSDSEAKGCAADV